MSIEVKDPAETSNDDKADENEKVCDRRCPPTYLIFVTFIACLGGSFNFGYQLLITNPAQDAFTTFLTASVAKTGLELTIGQKEVIWGVVASLFFWGAFVGSFLIQLVIDIFGHIKGITITLVVQIIASGCCVLSYFIVDHVLYAASRFVLGISITITMGIGTVFATECGSSKYHEFLISMMDIMGQVACLLGAVLSLPQVLGSPNLWWILYVIQIIWTISAAIGSLYFKESPLYFINYRKKKSALKSISAYNGLDEEAAKAYLSQYNQPLNEYIRIDFFTLHKLSPGLSISIVLALAANLNGFTILNSFSFYILSIMEMDSDYAAAGSAIICLMSLIGIVTSSFLFAKLKRRFILLTSYQLLAVINVLLTGCMFLFAVTSNPYFGGVCFLIICLFSFVVCAGTTPGSVRMTVELFEPRARSAIYCWMLIVSNLIRALIMTFFTPLSLNLGTACSYLMLSLPVCIIVIFPILLYLPETKGKTRTEIKSDFENKRLHRQSTIKGKDKKRTEEEEINLEVEKLTENQKN